MKFTKWELVLDYFTENIVLNQNQEEKLVLFFDEIQWLSSNRSTFINLLKYYWDNYWKKHNVMVILCGSIASFMIKKVIKSKALYGRISQEMLLKGLLPYEAPLFFNKNRSNEEILKYMLIFGGVPRYLEEIY